MSGYGERPARVLVAVAVAGLLLLALWPVLAPGDTPPAAPDWTALAPPASVPMRAWRSLTVVAEDRRAHLRIAPAPGQATRIEALAPWRLQQPIVGQATDAVIIAVAGAAEALPEEHLADLAAELVRRIPTLAIIRISAAPGLGLDSERLRFLVRGRLGR